MQMKWVKESLEGMKTDVLVIGIYEGTSALIDDVQRLDTKLSGQIAEVIAEGIFKGKEGQTETIFSRGQITSKRVVLLGLGKKEKLNGEVIRKSTALALKAAEKTKAVTMAMPVVLQKGLDAREVGRSLSEGLIMANYRFLSYKKKEDDGQEPTVQNVFLYGQDEHVGEQIDKGLEEGAYLAQGVMTARNLVNEPPNVMDPEAMAQKAEEIARKAGMTFEVLGREEMKDLKMGCFLGVAAGSVKPPKLVVMKYEGNPDAQDDLIGLVGKGLTFDSGGISLKPGGGMDEMKSDMAGAAAVLGAMEAIGQMKPVANVLAVVGLCENMPSGTAYRPGDILTSMNGKTVEILNTDAEGRLVLADCLSYAQQKGASRLVNVATLTGACVIALGNHASGLVSNDEQWQQSVVDAGKKAGEACWPLPAFDEYAEQLKSDVADLQNIGGKEAGAITAGLFLRAFVDDRPWVHMDIAGTSYTKKPKAYQSKGGTGVAVRTLAYLVSDWNHERV